MTEPEQTYYLIEGVRADAIIKDRNEAHQKQIERLSELAGAPVSHGQVSVAFSGRSARYIGVYVDTAPNAPGWKADKQTPGLFIPNRRLKAGRELEEALHKVDAGGTLHVLERHGINPWPVLPAFQSGSAGFGFFDHKVVIVWCKDWDNTTWPDWVKPIKRSEAYAIEEAYQEVHRE